MTTIVLLNMKLILKFGWNLRLIDETAVILGLCMLMSSRMKLVSLGMFKSETTILEEPWKQILIVIPNVYMMNQGVSIRGWHDPIPGPGMAVSFLELPTLVFVRHYSFVRRSLRSSSQTMQWRSPFCSMIFSSEYIFIAFYSWFSQPCWIPGGFLRSWCPMLAASGSTLSRWRSATPSQMSPRSLTPFWVVKISARQGSKINWGSQWLDSYPFWGDFRKGLLLVFY